MPESIGNVVFEADRRTIEVVSGLRGNELQVGAFSTERHLDLEPLW